MGSGLPLDVFSSINHLLVEIGGSDNAKIILVLGF